MSVHALKIGKLWVIPLATLVQSEPLIKWLMAIFVFASIATLEYQIGTLKAVVHFLHLRLGQLAVDGAAPLGTGKRGSASGAALGEASAGPAFRRPAFGTLTAGFYLLREPWRRLLMSGVTLYLIGQFTFERLDVSIAHVLAALIGLALAWAFWRKQVIREINTDEFWLTRPLASLPRRIKRERTSS